MEEEEEEEEFPSGHARFNLGTAEEIYGDMVAGHKVVLNFNGNPEELERVMKVALQQLSKRPDQIEDAWKREERKPKDVPSQSFWIDEVLEPLHKSMKVVHAIYVGTFSAVSRELDARTPGSLNRAIQLLSERHFESQETRGDFSAMRAAVEGLPGTPAEIEKYVKALERYFFEAAFVSVRTPMRALLEQLQDINKMQMSEGELKAAARREIGDLECSAEDNVLSVLGHVEKAWPEVLTSYYSAKLRVRQRENQGDKVNELLKRRRKLARHLTLSPEAVAEARIAELQQIDDELEELTN